MLILHQQKLKGVDGPGVGKVSRELTLVGSFTTSTTSTSQSNMLDVSKEELEPFNG